MDATGFRLVTSPALTAWAQAAWPCAQAVLGAAAAQDWRCGGTWFAGVDALPSDAAGAVAGGPGLPWADAGQTPEPLHPAQLSVVRTGYPQPMAGETASAFGYRRNRDGAHLDGLLPVGPTKARMVREPHGWIVGIGLSGGAPGAAPTVVWPGSHRILRAALATALQPHPVQEWENVDVTAAYQAARTRVFATCPRVEVPLAPGQAVLMHRHLLHGMAPWSAGDGMRAVAWFRPLMAGVAAWLGAD